MSRIERRIDNFFYYGVLQILIIVTVDEEIRKKTDGVGIFFIM